MLKPFRLFLLLAIVLAGVACHHQGKPLPAGFSTAWPQRTLQQARVLIDHTWLDEKGVQHMDHVIFDEVMDMIRQAERLIVVDMFLFNHSGGGEAMRPLSRELTEALLARKAAVPDIDILVITDPFNTFYGGLRSPWFEQLRAAGIPVLETPLTPLRDSNPLWSTPWRLCCQWLGNDPDGGWLPNPISDDPVPLRSYLALLNFKANHRKVLVVDHGDDLRGLVSSGNPHDGSSRHNNVALVFEGAMARDLLRSELAIADLAGVRPHLDAEGASGDQTATEEGAVMGRIVTEGKIGDAALAMVDSAGPGDHLELAMFYLSHRELTQALIRARQRGVAVRVLLDANRDAFGLKKDGVPNRPVARELHRNGIPVRWRNTHGEQFHTKALMRRDRDGQWQFLLGSANFTRRNLDDYNLETNVHVWGSQPSSLIDSLQASFEQQWQQGPDHPVTLSLPYEAWEDTSPIKYWRYRIMEATGLSTF